MAALISWVCSVDHSIPDRHEYQLNVTLHDGSWAYCQQGGDRDHAWVAIDPTPFEMLRFRRHTPAGSRTEEARTR